MAADTMDALMRIFGWSMNVLLSGETPFKGLCWSGYIRRWRREPLERIPWLSGSMPRRLGTLLPVILFRDVHLGQVLLVMSSQRD